MTTHKTEAGERGYAPIDGLDMYYEVHGTGRPLVLVPGGLMTIEMMGQLVPSLAETRQVVATELQGHGHTADIGRPLTYEQMADDVASLVRYLGFERADLLGFSMGGVVALRTALSHPDVVRKLVSVSANYTSFGEYPEIRELEATFDAESPVLARNRQAYANAAPTPSDWTALVDKMRDLLTGEAFDWTGAVAAMRVPTLVVVGDADVVSPAHALKMFALLGGATAETAMGRPSIAQLAVLPGTTHFTILQQAELLGAMVNGFLDA